jgi:hypothetical protein
MSATLIAEAVATQPVESFDAAVWQAIERIEEKYAESLSATSGWLIVIPDFRGGSVTKP